jgi:hypothetical protein
VREHYRFLLRSARALTGSRAVAEDVVQDCYASAWKNRGQLRRSELARAWLLQIIAPQRVAPSLPGSPQLMRPCNIEGHLVYRLTTFFEKGSMVTVIAFARTVALYECSGWWGNVHWHVVTLREGKPLVMLAQQEKVPVVARASFAKPLA